MFVSQIVPCFLTRGFANLRWPIEDTNLLVISESPPRLFLHGVKINQVFFSLKDFLVIPGHYLLGYHWVSREVFFYLKTMWGHFRTISISHKALLNNWNFFDIHYYQFTLGERTLKLLPW